MKMFLFIANVLFGVANIGAAVLDIIAGWPAVAVLNVMVAGISFFTAFVVASE